MNNVMINRMEAINKILEERGSEFTVDFKECQKNNMILPAYTLISKTQNCTPIVYYHEDWFNRTGNEVVDFLTEIYNSNKMTINMREYTNREYIINNVLPRMRSDKNLERIEKSDNAYMPYLDMLVTFYVPIPLDRNEGEYSSLVVSNELLDKCNLTVDDIYDYAVTNMGKDIVVDSMLNIMMQEFNLSMEELGIDGENPNLVPPMYIATNSNKINGAATMLSDKTFEILEKHLGKQFAILPSSIHECIAVSYNDESDLPRLLNMVNDVNNTSVYLEDKLTDSVYIYRDNELTKYA